ncbi:MAG: hypothetical protein IIB46_04240 [Nitrospinae bacterium]|nr:hypothetical protein [Nitrospinota bacterium]
MINVLQLRLAKWHDIEPLDDAIYIFVDCSFGQKNMSIKEMPKIVIDHHKILTNNKEVLFIHDEVGACSTLVLDLALLVTYEVDEDGEETAKEALQCFDPDEEGIAGVPVTDGVNFVLTDKDGSYEIRLAHDPVIPFQPAQVVSITWPSGT